MNAVVLITGANGMLARSLAKSLDSNYTVRFLTRKVTRQNEFKWDIKLKYIDPEALKDVNHIIHLAGSSVAEKRWTLKRKRDIYSSRVDSAQLILNENVEHVQGNATLANVRKGGLLKQKRS